MKIFKFGGASVKDSDGIKNVVKVLQEVGYENVLIVVSAMGKTTNAMEEIVKHYINKDNELNASIQEVKKYHNQILLALFENEKHKVFTAIQNIFDELVNFLTHNKSINYDFVYDQIVSIGEILSSTIISFYFNEIGIKNQWIDSREIIKTDSNYRDANIDWLETQINTKPLNQSNILYISQGFIGSDSNNFTTTLGREGSDYTAAILGYCIGAESVTIWKDVPGVLNADPRFFENAVLLEQISYREAIELAFYGASVIHPKTLQPLQKKEIPLYVKSFINPLLPGTKVSRGVSLQPEISCFIVKKNQFLISISSLDFSFIMEENISEIFALLHQLKLKVNLIQNSAISFSLCLEDKYHKFENLKKELSNKYLIQTSENVSLYTVRHFTDSAIKTVESNKEILIKQILGNTIQLVIKE
ncbi:MAG: aspartate kinase [Flavobacterium sp.]|jgi:aspartate kinase